MIVHLPENPDQTKSYPVRLAWEQGDAMPSNESVLFYKAKMKLIGNPSYTPRNPDWVKVHEVPGLNSIPYALRCDRGRYKGWWIYDPNYMIRNPAKDYRKDKQVVLQMEYLGGEQ